MTGGGLMMTEVQPVLIGDFTIRITMVPGMFTATATGNESGRSASASSVSWTKAMLEAMHALAKSADV